MDATPLADAWWLMGPDEQKEQYRSAGQNEGLTAYLEKYLRDDIIFRIHVRDLVAIGVQTAPKPGEGPELIPGFLFASPDVDWKESNVRAMGRSYEHVRVIRPEIIPRLEQVPAQVAE